MKKIKIKYKNTIDEKNKNINNNLTKSISENINEKFINKGINTSMTQQYNYYNRKRIPSYIRLPNINRISFPNNDIDLGINDKINSSNNNSLFTNYSLLKEDKNKFINKNFSVDNLISKK